MFFYQPQSNKQKINELSKKGELIGLKFEYHIESKYDDDIVSELYKNYRVDINHEFTQDELNLCIIKLEWSLNNKKVDEIYVNPRVPFSSFTDVHLTQVNIEKNTINLMNDKIDIEERKLCKQPLGCIL